MVITKDQLAKQVQDTYAKGIATGKTREEVIGAMKDKLKSTGQYDAMKQIATGVTPPTQDQLKAKIATGNFTASEAKQYNDMTGSQTGARDLALTSKQGVQNLQTTITPEETAKIAQAGITNVGEGVKADLQGGTQEQFKQNVEKVTKQETPTGTVTTTETPKDTQKIESIDQFKQAGGGFSNLEQLVENRYGTVATQEQDGITAVVNGEKFKWTIDNAGNPIKTSLGRVETQTPDQIFQTLSGGGQIDTNTKGYTEAKTRFNQYSQYKDFTDKQFQTAFNEGLILPGTQLYNDLSKNPKIKLQMDKANALNRVNGEKTDSNKVFETQSEEIGNNTKVDINGQTMSLKKAMEDGYIDKDEYNQITNTPEVTSKLQEVEDLKNKADELQNIYDNVRLEVEESLKGTGATKSDLESIVGERQKNMLGNLNLSISKYNNALGTLTELKKTNSEMFATNLGLYQNELNRQYQLEQEQRQRGYQMEDMRASQDFSLYQNELNRQYQTEADQRNFEQQKEMLKLQQDYQNANIQTDIIQVGNKNVLINRKTGEKIKSYDLPETETGKVTYGVTGEDEFGNKQYGFINTGSQTVSTGTGGTTTGGLDFIRGQEGFRDKAYWDVNGWAIGYGQHSINGKAVKKGDTITQQEAETDLQNRVTNAKFNSLITVPLTENQATALYDLEHNVGSGVWNYPNGKKIIDLVNKGNFNGAANVMATSGIGTTNAGTGQVMQGLVKRRQQAAELLRDTTTQNLDEYTNMIIGSAGGLSKVSNDERTDIRRQAKGWIAEGLTPQQAYLKYKGFNLKDNTKQAQAENLLNMGDSLLPDVKPKNFEQKVSEYINKGDTKAISNYITSLVEADVKKRMGTDAIPYSSLKSQTQLIGQLLPLIEKNKSKIGPVAGTLENFTNKFAGDADFTKMKALLQGVQADLRKNFAGSAVTATEMQALENFIGGTEKMNPNNLMTQLRTLNDKTRTEYENQRSIYGIKPANIRLGGTSTVTGKSTQYKANSGKVYNLNDYK